MTFRESFTVCQKAGNGLGVSQSCENACLRKCVPAREVVDKCVEEMEHAIGSFGHECRHVCTHTHSSPGDQMQYGNIPLQKRDMIIRNSPSPPATHRRLREVVLARIAHQQPLSSQQLLNRSQPREQRARVVEVPRHFRASVSQQIQQHQQAHTRQLSLCLSSTTRRRRELHISRPPLRQVPCAVQGITRTPFDKSLCVSQRHRPRGYGHTLGKMRASN